MKQIVGVLFLFLLLSGCSDFDDFFDARHDELKSKLDGGEDLGDDVTLDFATIKRLVLQDNCINCHQPNGRHEAYEEYALVKASAAQILERMTTTNAALVMPKGRPRLSDEVIGIFEAWIEAGTPEFAKADNDDDDDEPQPQPEAQIGFEQIRKEVLEPNNCIACHSHFNDYGMVRRGIGGIVGLIKNNSMPFPVKKGETSVPVPQKDRDLLNKWIAQGMPEFPFKAAEPLSDIEIKPNWISLRNHVFGPKCTACHNSFGNRAGGIEKSLDTYTNFQNWVRVAQEAYEEDQKEGGLLGLNPLVIMDPENPEFGDLHTTITGDPENEFAFPTPMPYNNPFDDVQVEFQRLTADEIKLVEQWIKAGLPFDE